MKFAVVLFVAAVVSRGQPLEDDEPDNKDIEKLLGVRPDLVEDLMPGDEDSRSAGGASGAGVDGMLGKPPSQDSAKAAGSNDAVDKLNEQMGCVNECGQTDQSCRARCLGVPGVASRKMPRKQDISGNLPLNWKMRNENVSAAKASDSSAEDGDILGAASLHAIPRLLVAAAISMALVAAGYL